jgi:ribonuclease HI
VAVKIFTDGASRGNPGRAAIAFIILSAQDTILMKGSRGIGIRTNNQAEYEALIYALDSAKQLHAESLMCYLDSLLIVNQLNGVYKVANPHLRRLWNQVCEQRALFHQITFHHVPRNNEYITIVDQLANRRLDSELR